MAEQEHEIDRRGLFRWIINGVVTAIGAVVTVVAGGAIVAPSLKKPAERWLPAGRILGLQPETPTPVTVRVVRREGYYEAVDHETVFLIREPGGEVRALSSICTHLGCHVHWDAKARLFKCPCHGGVYDINGKVVSGPPPRPLATYPTRMDQNEVFVEL
ncbi:MAG TPA: ubiquinol-cytochrome c reductase iron-sulfur subunit [Vicinamibacterales bacterium]|nr:ubiquinol-cytochrome c reductase iron-sulfur subunit [Vicinamibacterales bacterium]